MNKILQNTAFAIAIAAATFASCSPNHYTVTVSDDVLNADFFGNGVEWDPYDESISWCSRLSDADCGESGTLGENIGANGDGLRELGISDADRKELGTSDANWKKQGISDADWDKLYSRMDCLRPQYVRCMINSPYLYFDKDGDAVSGQHSGTGHNSGAGQHSGYICAESSNPGQDTGSNQQSDEEQDSGAGYRFSPERNAGTEYRFSPERNSRNIIKLLTWCETRKVSVIFGEFNPPEWSMKDSDAWVRMSVEYLNWLVEDNGFSCIKSFVIFNEPDGNWASTDGDFGLWQKMYRRFNDEMRKYPALDAVSLAGPDAVLNYTNPASEFDSYGWVSQSASGLDSLTGIYDIHCYPGQHYVRSGEFASDVERIRSIVPEGKRFIFGEGGFKYYEPEDSTLMQEYWRRVSDTPFTEGSDCNMLVTDWFYALDMPIFAIEAMNNGASGVAAWMLDDAMHSNSDSGKPEDIKIWGMWNILGEEVFGDASLEDIRPWFYTWTMVCRCFPSGCDIVRIDSDLPDGVFAAASKTADGGYSAVFVNVTSSDITADVSFPGIRATGSSLDRYRTFTITKLPEQNIDDESGKNTGAVCGSCNKNTDRGKSTGTVCGSCNKNTDRGDGDETAGRPKAGNGKNCQKIEYCQISEQKFKGSSGTVKIPAMSFVAITSLFTGSDSPFDSIRH